MNTIKNNNNNNSNSNNTTNKNKKRRAARRNNIRRRTRRQRIKRQIIIKNNPTRQAAFGSIPMAIPLSYRRYFNMKNMGETAVKISGCDLIYKIPDNIQTLQNTNVMTIIPANPAYWTGTRISAIAQGYQNYRPVALKIHYCPQCPVTQQGNVIGGTLWDDVPSADSIQQSLKTSNGGFLTQCYQPISTTIRLKSNLQINLYRMAGDINQQSNPFYFIALSIAAYNNNNQLINPGIFYVEYTYILKNPIGVSTQYINSGITTHEAQNNIYANCIAITCKNLQVDNTLFPPGTRLNVEKNLDEDVPTYYYNNTSIAAPNIPLWYFMNQPITNPIQVRARPPIPDTPTYDALYFLVAGESISREGLITIPANSIIVYLTDDSIPNHYTLIYNKTNNNVQQNIGLHQDVYQTEFNENGVPMPITIERTDQALIFFTAIAIITEFLPFP